MTSPAPGRRGDSWYREAEDAGRHSGAALGQLGTIDEFVDGSALLARIWGTEKDASPMAADLLASLAHAGAAVIGAFIESRLVGLAMAGLRHRLLSTV